jgi:hypothetical protein
MPSTSTDLARRRTSLAVRPTTPERKSTCLIEPSGPVEVTFASWGVASSSDGTQTFHPRPRASLAASWLFPRESASEVMLDASAAGRGTFSQSTQKASA